MKKRRKKSNISKAIVIALVIFLITISLLKLRETLLYAVTDFARIDAVNIMTQMIDQTVSEYLKENAVNYNNLCSLEKSQDGKITALTVDSVALNTIKSDLSLMILQRARSLGKCDYNVPIGSLLQSVLLSGRGFNIKVRIVPTGSVASQINNSFIAAGINQTCHRISLRVMLTFSVLAPFTVAGATVEQELPIAETIIFGEVPDAYITVNGEPITIGSPP